MKVYYFRFRDHIIDFIKIYSRNKKKTKYTTYKIKKQINKLKSSASRTSGEFRILSDRSSLSSSTFFLFQNPVFTFFKRFSSHTSVLFPEIHIIFITVLPLVSAFPNNEIQWCKGYSPLIRVRYMIITIIPVRQSFWQWHSSSSH